MQKKRARMWIEAMGRVDGSEFLFVLFVHCNFICFLTNCYFFFFFGRFTRHICLDRGAGVVG